MAEQHQQKLQDLPEAIRPIYTTPNPNDRVLLYEGDIEVHQSNQPRTTENGSLYISCLPNFDVDFELPEIEGNIYNDEDVHLKIPSINLSGDAFLRNVVFGNKHACTGTFRKPVYRGNLALSDCIIFHVINFPGYAGEHIRDSEATTFWNGRLNMQSSTWVLTLDRVREGGQLIKALKREGGFAITHVGKVARTDGQQVQLQDAQKVLGHIGYFLSFLNGMWTHPVLPTGFVGINELWQEWGAPHLTRWRSVRKWFPYETPQALPDISQAFYGYMEKCENAAWEDPLKSAIHWYVEANLSAGGVEGAIVLAGTALELLGWMHLVIAKKQLTVKQFNNASAATNLRLLLSDMNIPVQIPQEMSNLHQLGATDGPDALVMLRNRIVHPPSKSGQSLITSYPRLMRQEVKDLGLWYLELVILRLFGYRGSYYQRFRSGFPNEVIDSVPWR